VEWTSPGSIGWKAVGKRRLARRERPSTVPSARTTSTGTRPPATLRELTRVVRACTSCELHHDRIKPVVGVGPNDARLMVVGFVPGRHEDLQGAPFAGSIRNLLHTGLSAVGLEPEQVRFSSLVRCRPAADRRPAFDHAQTCSAHLQAELRLVSPEVVVSLGSEVTSMLLGRPVPLERVAGYRLDILQGTTLVPTYHPAAASRGGGTVADLRAHLAVAKAVLDGRMGTGAQALADLRARVAADR
jgi:uracil-DNA glycosylase